MHACFLLACSDPTDTLLKRPIQIPCVGFYTYTRIYINYLDEETDRPLSLFRYSYLKDTYTDIFFYVARFWSYCWAKPPFSSTHLYFLRFHTQSDDILLTESMILFHLIRMITYLIIQHYLISVIILKDSLRLAGLAWRADFCSLDKVQ